MIQKRELIKLNIEIILVEKETEKEITETISFMIAMRRTKYLGINLPKETKDLYIENYKTLMKEIKEDTNGEIYYVHGLEESI